MLGVRNPSLSSATSVSSLFCFLIISAVVFLPLLALIFQGYILHVQSMILSPCRLPCDGKKIEVSKSLTRQRRRHQREEAAPSLTYR